MRSNRGFEKVGVAVIAMAMVFAIFAISVRAQNAFPGDLAGISNPKVFINQNEFKADYPVITRAGVAFIPLTDDLEIVLGAELDIDSTAGINTYTFETLEATIVFTEGETGAVVDGVSVQLEVAPFVQNGFLHVPLVNLFFYLGCDVQLVGAEFHIEKKPMLADIIGDIPEDFIGPGKISTIDVAPEIPVTTEPVHRPDLIEIGYTYENKLKFENITVSGDTVQSNLIPKTDFYDQLTFRTEGAMRNGYNIRSVFRLSGTTEHDLNGGKADSLNLMFYQDKIQLQLYDIVPKVSKFALKSYPLQGFQYSRQNNLFKWTALWGKSPKRLRDSYYNRYARGLLIEDDVRGSAITLGYVTVKDTGVLQNEDRLINDVLTLRSLTTINDLKLDIEVSKSSTEIAESERIKGNAKWVEAKYRNRSTRLVSSYERIGSDYYSESTFFTPGRREAQALVTHRISKKLTLGGGYKTTRLMGSSTSLIPLQATFYPWSKRPKLKFKVQKNFEKSQTVYGPRIKDKRKIDISDRIGKAKVNMSIERRRDKDTFSEWKFKTTQRYRYITSLSKALQLILQYKTELKTNSSNPRKRYYQSKFVFSLGEWEELSLNFERYYQNTSNDRVTSGLTYSSLDIINDREYALEYRFLNYSGHNDNYLMLSYSFLK